MYNAVYHQLSDIRADRSQTRMRLIMFGFAGGRIATLASLAKQLPSWVEVWGAEYPGRGFRWKTVPLTSAEHLLDDLTPGLRALCDQPVVLLGYSMGAKIAYHLALNLPGQVFGVIAASAPSPYQRTTDWRKQSDQQLVKHLGRLGGIPQEILSNQTILDVFLPVVRADLACSLDMNCHASRPLKCPVLVMHGSGDPITSKTEALQWLQIGGGRPGQSLCKVYPGGHFFHQGSEEVIALDIGAWLSGLLSMSIL